MFTTATLINDIRSTQVTLGPKEVDVPDGEKEVPEDYMVYLHSVAHNPCHAMIAEYKKAIRKYPYHAALKNYLYNTYHMLGREKAASKILSAMKKRHPDYLFAKLAVANEFCSVEKPNNALAVLGENLSLQKLYPHDAEFHFSEFVGYFSSVLFYLLTSEQLDSAEAVLNTLEELGYGEEENIVNFRGKYEMLRVSEGLKKLTENAMRAEKIQILPEVKEAQYPCLYEEMPAFQHKEVEALYHHDYTISNEILDGLLDLPRESIIQDLELVLEDAVARFPIFNELNDQECYDELYFPTHALMLLGDLGATESAPTILSFFKMSPNALSVYMTDCWQYLSSNNFCTIFAENMELSLEWMKTPGVDHHAKSIIVDLMIEYAVESSSARKQVLEWVNAVIKIQLVAVREDQLIDTSLNTKIIDKLIYIRASELTESIRALYASNLGFHILHDDVDSVINALSKTMSLAPARFKNTYEVYRYQIDLINGGDSVETASDYDGDAYAKLQQIAWLGPNESLADNIIRPNFSNHQQQRVETNTPRNAPCPCGSGKKYKRCCMDG
ncbi:MAG: hypothetical protein ACI9SQ_000480 [Rubritalea sp.]|jgi:hypothetical protein